MVRLAMDLPDCAWAGSPNWRSATSVGVQVAVTGRTEQSPAPGCLLLPVLTGTGSGGVHETTSGRNHCHRCSSVGWRHTTNHRRRYGSEPGNRACPARCASRGCHSFASHAGLSPGQQRQFDQEVADVLRHRSLDTSWIYAKLDLQRLPRSPALVWGCIMSAQHRRTSTSPPRWSND